MNTKFIPLSVPNFEGNEEKYVNDAVKSTWVSTGGGYVTKFEETLAQYVKMPQAVATASGTAALHLALIVAGVGRGDEVIAATLTFIAAVNPIKYAGAEPIFVDCDDYLCMDPKSVRAFLETNCEIRDGKTYNKNTGAHVKAMMPVHVFGNMCDMEALMDIAKEYNLVVIEDATEALGSYYKEGRYAGKFAGTIGDVGCYSFNGNKIITTGGGGMLVSNRPEWAKRAKHLSTQAKADEVRFFHDEIGYNYRMTNLQAALGVAQMECLEKFITVKERNYDYYVQALHGKNGLEVLPFRTDIRANKWFYSVLLKDCGKSTDDILAGMSEAKIQTRPIWKLISDLEPYKGAQCADLSNAHYYFERVVNIPCTTNLTLEDAAVVADRLLEITE
ncbi:MAG: LegC family aminotransferase [Oscillospiraceae bacterium]|nr:LegC family aminotransferase [Oscillospiraceae bacterium]